MVLRSFLFFWNGQTSSLKTRHSKLVWDQNPHDLPVLAIGFIGFLVSTWPWGNACIPKKRETCLKFWDKQPRVTFWQNPTSLQSKATRPNFSSIPGCAAGTKRHQKAMCKKMQKDHSCHESLIHVCKIAATRGDSCTELRGLVSKAAPYRNSLRAFYTESLKTHLSCLIPFQCFCNSAHQGWSFAAHFHMETWLKHASAQHISNGITMHHGSSFLYLHSKEKRWHRLQVADESVTHSLIPQSRSPWHHEMGSLAWGSRHILVPNGYRLEAPPWRCHCLGVSVVGTSDSFWNLVALEFPLKRPTKGAAWCQHGPTVDVNRRERLWITSKAKVK